MEKHLVERYSPGSYHGVSKYKLNCVKSRFDPIVYFSPFPRIAAGSKVAAPLVARVVIDIKVIGTDARFELD